MLDCMDSPPKKLLVLDVNGLLVDSYFFTETHPEETPDARIGNFFVYKRPYCDEFVTFCLDNFVVGIWSSAKQHNVENLVNYIFQAAKGKLAFIWHQLDCTDTGLHSPENQCKPLFLKELSKLWTKLKVNLPWKEGQFGPGNTLLIDDTPYKALRNPPNTAIFPRSYIFDGSEDSFLGDALRIYLEGVRDAFNVQKYVKENPFGEPSITPESPLWRYFSPLFKRDETCMYDMPNICLEIKQGEKVKKLDPPEASSHSDKNDMLQQTGHRKRKGFSNSNAMSPGRNCGVSLLEMPKAIQAQDHDEVVELLNEECMYSTGKLQPRLVEALPCNNDKDLDSSIMQSSEYDARKFKESSSSQDCRIRHAKSKKRHVYKDHKENYGKDLDPSTTQSLDYDTRKSKDSISSQDCRIIHSTSKRRHVHNDKKDNKDSQINESDNPSSPCYESDSLIRSYHRKHEVRWKSDKHRHNREDFWCRSNDTNCSSSSNRLAKDAQSSKRERHHSIGGVSHVGPECHEKKMQLCVPEAHNWMAAENGSRLNQNDQPSSSISYCKNRDRFHANHDHVCKAQHPVLDMEMDSTQSLRYNRVHGGMEDTRKSKAGTDTMRIESGTPRRNSGHKRKHRNEETNRQST